MLKPCIARNLFTLIEDNCTISVKSFKNSRHIRSYCCKILFSKINSSLFWFFEATQKKSGIASVSHPPNIREESFRWKEMHERRLPPSVHLFQLFNVSQALQKRRVLPVGSHRCPIEPGGQPVVIPAVPNQNSLIQQLLVQFPVPGLKENVIGIGREYSEP